MVSNESKIKRISEPFIYFTTVERKKEEKKEFVIHLLRRSY